MDDWATQQEELLRFATRQLFFVGGAPRSGTTWLQQILDAHPDISCRGEGLFLNRLAVPMESLIAQWGEAIAQKNTKLFSHNRSLLDVAPSQIRQMLTYKAEWYGSRLIAVLAAFTSQRCSACQHTHKDNRKSQSGFLCLKCGHSENADINAAKNILASGLKTGGLPGIACGSNRVSGRKQEGHAVRLGSAVLQGREKSLHILTKFSTLSAARYRPLERLHSPDGTTTRRSHAARCSKSKRPASYKPMIKP